MILWSTIVFASAFLAGITHSKDLVGREQDMLDRNLKVLRKDFNKLIENVEDFAGDFLKQIQDAGKLVGTAYVNEEDYSWQDEKLNAIKQTSQKDEASSVPTSTETVTSEPTYPPSKKSKYPNFYKSPAKYIEQELSNDIQTRKRRSAPPIAPNDIIGERQSAPMRLLQNGQRPLAQMGQNVEERLPAPITNQRLGKNEEKTIILESQQDQTTTINNKQNFNEICSSTTQKEINMEQQKMEELKMEVKKLNELVVLLKDQQRLIKVMGEEDMGLDKNDVNGSLNMDSLENSFLYKVLKQMETRGKADRVQHANFDNVQGKLHKSNLDIPNAEINDLKVNMKKTEESLNQTKEMLIKEKEKEDILESELKRQNSELKFLKVMMENLYDKSNALPEYKHNTKESVNHKGLRSSEFEDNIIDSVLGTVHTPKPWPKIGSFESKLNRNVPNIQRKSTNDEQRDTVSNNNAQRFLKSLATNQGIINNKKSFRNTRTAQKTTESSIKKRLDEIFHQVHKQFENKYNPFSTFNKDFEREFLANQTKSALIEMTKHDADRFKKFNPNTRESSPSENQDANMHRLLSILSKQGNQNGNNQLVRSDQDHIQNSQTNHVNNEKKNNETFLSQTARASSNSKTDDLDFKLKLIDMLANEGKSNDVNQKEKQLDEAMKKLLQPEKKSDDEITLDALKALVKEKQEPPKNTQDSLTKLLKTLNEKPQTKTDEPDIQSELRELQRAINDLRPKEDNGFNSFDLGDNRRGKDENQDFQSMLNQLITQNGVTSNGLAAQSTLNIGGTGIGSDLNSFGVNAHSSHATGLQDLIKSYMSSQVAHNHPNVPLAYSSNLNSYSPSPIPYSQFGSNLNGYNPNSNLYSPGFGSNLYGANLNNAYSHPYNTQYGPNPYSAGPDSYSNRPYSSAPYNSNLSPYGSGPYSNTYHATPNSYGGGYNMANLGYSAENHQPYSASQYQSSAYTPSYANYAPSTSNTNSYSPSSYGSSYQPPKTNYQSPSYQPGSYSANSQVPNGYSAGLSSGTVGYNGIASHSYGEGASAYPGVTNGYKTKYDKPLFQSTSAAEGNYQGYNYGPKSYAGPSLDQSYGANQNSDQYKYGMVSDLTQQIQNLENIISGLNKGGDYSQSVDDKTAIAGLEEKIYELKGVLASLNQPSYPQPSYGAQQPSYQANKQSYGQTTSTAAYNQNPEPLYPGQKHESYVQSRPSYSSSQPSPGPYGAQQGQYPSAQSPSPTPYQAAQPSYRSKPSSAPTQVPYQASPHGTSPHGSVAYQPPSGPPSDSSASYQPKESMGEDRRLLRIGHKKLGLAGNEEKNGRRKKREAGGPPTVLRPEDGADMNVKLRQGDERGRPAGYDLGEDALVQIANTFKRYLEDNLTQTQPQFQPRQDGVSMDPQQTRNSAFDGLQQKLDALKIQLESQKPSAKSLYDHWTPPGAYNVAPSYGSQNNYYPYQYSNSFHIPKVTSKHNDIFTEILIKILQKTLNSLPEVLHRLFGNLLTGIGDSYGDSYSPLQNILKNLGVVGYGPLIFVKILESVGAVLKQLKKNPVFKQFLLPAIALAAAGAGILFMMFFFQQDEPYGYIGYQGNDYHKDYPQYEPKSYGNHYDSSTDHSHSYHKEASYLRNYRSNIDRNGYNDNMYNDNTRRYDNPNYEQNNNGNNAPSEYFRGYYDYPRNNLDHRTK